MHFISNEISSSEVKLSVKTIIDDQIDTLVGITSLFQETNVGRYLVYNTTYAALKARMVLIVIIVL